MGEVNRNGEYSQTIIHISEQQNIKLLKQIFQKLFSRQGKIRGYKTECEFRNDATIFQQKEKRIPLQLQDAVEDEIEKLVKEGHIRRVDKNSDERSYNL